jgi:aminoglycoside phosphotransferase (APT) family kinase protein
MMRALGAIQDSPAGNGWMPGESTDQSTSADLVRAELDRAFEKMQRQVGDRFSPLPILRDAHLWLKEHTSDLPVAEPVLVHGDFRFGNLIWDCGRLAAVIDWERASTGDPMQDLGFMCMPIARNRRPELMGMVATEEDLFSLYTQFTDRAVDRRAVHFFTIYWQFLETCVLVQGLDLASREPSFRQAFTAYPQLRMGTQFLIEGIEDSDAGRYLA